MREFKVFYSWQSDLPSSRTRYLIQDCIDEAIKKVSSSVNGITFVADRDTKGLTGAPPIPQTIFSKIDECDLFIADVSLVNKYQCFALDEESDIDCDEKKKNTGSIDEQGKKSEIKYTPNPNVLIELGYAVNRLGWERIICFINTDYGAIEELPFDLEHQRVTPFSFIQKTRKAVLDQLRPILVDTILEFAEKPALPKKGKAFHRIGTYDLETRQIDNELIAYNVRNCPWIDLYYEEQKDKARQLIAGIQAVILPDKPKTQKTFSNQDMNSIMASLTSNNNLIDYSVPDWIKEEIIRLSKEYLDELSSIFDQAFFNVGNIKVPIVSPTRDIFGRKMSISKHGSVEELDKEQNIQNLLCVLNEMERLSIFLKTFDNIVLLPLAIENTSVEFDRNIEVIICFNVDEAESLWPNKEMIIPDLADCRVEIYQSDYIRRLLRMEENGDIKYEGDMWYDNSKPFYWSGISSMFADYDDSDYENAIAVFIAEPITNNEYSFSLKSLKAGEKKWIGAMIALKTCESPITLKYQIKSNNIDGNNEGTLVYSGKKR